MLFFKGCDILVGTPGRIKGFTSDGKVSLKKVRFLVLDEADRMLDQGFEPEIRKIEAEMPSKEERQTLMFSATFPNEVNYDAVVSQLIISCSTLTFYGYMNTAIRLACCLVSKGSDVLCLPFITPSCDPTMTILKVVAQTK